MSKKAEHISRLKITKIVKNKNGTSTLHFDLDKDFVKWFKEKEGLKRFSHKRFQKFISDAIKNSGEDGFFGTLVKEEGKNIQNK
tara:strand:- start:1369 stop:1620 length:252 start_codon:yes stop_codon:yes gene_type:complete